MYRVAIFDDDSRQCEVLADLIAQSPYGGEMEVSSFTDLAALAAFVTARGEPDICFMDIRSEPPATAPAAADTSASAAAPVPAPASAAASDGAPGVAPDGTSVAEGSPGLAPGGILGTAAVSPDTPAADGIQAVARLFPAGSHTQVIYVTGYAEYCVPVYETQHIYLLLKPVQPPQLAAALARAVANLRAQEHDWLAVVTGGAVMRLPSDKIVYVESMRRKAVLYTTDGVVETYAKLSEIAGRLPGRFVRSHKSYLVNMDHIDAVERKTILLSTGATVPVSRQRSAATREAFRRHLLGREGEGEGQAR